MDLNNLNFLARVINTVVDPSVYEKNRNYINKPMEDIPFGHILNVNWDNIAGSFNIIRDYMTQAVYVDLISATNTANKLVLRGTGGGIQVGDIFTNTAIGAATFNNSVGIAYKGADGKINYSNNFESLREAIGAQKAGEETPPINLLWDGNITLSNNSSIITLNNDARKYSVLVGVACPHIGDGRPQDTVLVFPNFQTGITAMNRNGGSYAFFLWDGGVSVTLRSQGWRDGGSSTFTRVYGLL